MEQLNSLIKDASNEFECHNFQTSLFLYVRCIQRCTQQKLPNFILFNLKTSEAALRTILGEYESALSILNQVLSQDKQHWLALIRRSQVYKKQNKYKKALKDLDILSMYAPDNMQVAALKLELKGLMTKPNGSSSSENQQEQEEQKMDEQQCLQFSNLRKIDRTSVSIMLPKGRQSRVTITGDNAFFYQANNDDQEPIRQSKMYTPSFNCQRFIQIENQLQETNQSDTNEALPVIIKAKPVRGKSILRNRDSKIYVADKVQTQDKELQQKLLKKIQNIDGHVIGSDIGSSKQCSERQVGFRKSLFANTPPVIIPDTPQIKLKSKPTARKSCLKRSSFTAITQQIQKKGPRRSKFQTMARSSIDGKFIKSDKKKKQAQNEASKQNIPQSSVNNNDSQNQSEQGSQFNIFGSKKLVLNQQLRQNLGLGSDPIVEESEAETKEKKKKQRGQSILKKTSILVKKQAPKKKASVFFKEHQQEQQKSKPQRKNKKSVMFLSC